MFLIVEPSGKVISSLCSLQDDSDCLHGRSPLESRPVQNAAFLAAISAEFQFIEHTRRQMVT